MRKHACVALALSLVVGLVLSMAVARGQEEEPAVRRIKVPVKQYKPVTPGNVYRAAMAGTQASVRFRDAFTRAVSVPEGAAQVEVAGRTYNPLLAFRTAGDLICLIPATSPDAVRTVLGVPQGRPVPPAALERGMVLNDGQQITIEGTVVGTLAGAKYVLVDRVLLTPPTQPAGRRELHLLLPGQREPRVMSSPGSQTDEFPCSYVEDATETLTVTVEQKSDQELAADVARLTAQLEGLRSETKSYGQYSPGTVYRHAGATEGRVNVDFTDRVANVFSPPLPEGTSTASTGRRGVPTEVNVAYAFETEGRVTCLVPNTWPTLTEQARRLLPGEQVRVRGTTVGPAGPRNRVLVDMLSFPEELDDTNWWVTLQLGEDGAPTILWDEGYYRLTSLPCRHAARRFEPVQVLVSRFRTVTMQQFRRPQPAAEEQEGGE